MESSKVLHVPFELFRELSDRAKMKGTSVDAHAAELLLKAMGEEAEEAQLLAAIRKEREELVGAGLFLTDESLAEAKRWGRK
jgi:plasmid stability protein